VSTNISTGPVVVIDRMAEDPPIPTLTGLLARRTQDAPDREFLRFGEWSWTFGEIDAWTSRLAHRLIELDRIEPGDRVAIMLPNVVHWPIAWLAALKAGAVVVPINSSYRSADLEFVLRDSGARVVVTDGEHAALVAEVSERSPELTGVRILDVASDGSESFPETAPWGAIDGATLANLQYTSGTTGFPKACMLTHGYWTRLGWICAGATGLGGDDVLLTAQPFSYMDPQWNTALALAIGAPLVVLPRFSASTFMADVRRHRATFFYVLGSMPTLIFKQPPSPADRDNDLRMVFCSAIPVSLHAQLEERWGAPWREVYGMTESGIDLYTPFDDATVVGTGTLGQPVATKRARVVGPDGTDVPDEEPGELIISGAPMMSGYWNRTEATAEVLRDGWLHTGDLGFLDADGYLRVVDRKKDLIIRGGFNVFPRDVEEALLEHPAVAAAGVVGRPDDLHGEEVVAFVELSANYVGPEDLVAFCKERIGGYKYPREVHVVPSLPLTPVGKLDRKALRSQVAVGA
jgi:acyl-CoA synthetase (AMP-forming)/AMP-acid ligase II